MILYILSTIGTCSLLFLSYEATCRMIEHVQANRYAGLQEQVTDAKNDLVEVLEEAGDFKVAIWAANEIERISTHRIYTDKEGFERRFRTFMEKYHYTN